MLAICIINLAPGQYILIYQLIARLKNEGITASLNFPVLFSFIVKSVITINIHLPNIEFPFIDVC